MTAKAGSFAVGSGSTGGEFSLLMGVAAGDGADAVLGGAGTGAVAEASDLSGGVFVGEVTRSLPQAVSNRAVMIVPNCFMDLPSRQSPEIWQGLRGCCTLQAQSHHWSNR